MDEESISIQNWILISARAMPLQKFLFRTLSIARTIFSSLREILEKGEYNVGLFGASE